MIYERILGVPRFECEEFESKRTAYCILIPVLNEHTRIEAELERAKAHKIDQLCDIILCDGASTDGCADSDMLPFARCQYVANQTRYR